MKDPSKIYDSWSISKSKAVNELAVVDRLLRNLSIDTSTLATTGPNDPPDCVLDINAIRVGIEVVALINARARELSAKARHGKSSEFYADWTKESFRSALVNLVANKEAKILAGKMDGKSAAHCDKFWLVVHSDEFTLASCYVQEYVAGWNLISAVFDEIFLVLSYEPGRTGDGYPWFKLNSGLK